MIAIEILNAFGDNYIYVVEYGTGVCFAVDPGEAAPVESVVSQRNVELTHILATHHHFDHIGGIGELKKTYGCRVVGPDKQRISSIDTVVQDGDVIELGAMTVRCIATPGHTSTGICYFMTGQPLEVPVLFTGDTLFVCGCGRLFEGDANTMFTSLQKIAALPDETCIYPGHDYTAEDLQFALRYEPDNDALQKKLDEIHHNIRHGRPTVPSTLAEEKNLNPFLKANTWQKLADLRNKKDVF
jgi:hydroxyacylglutathione hydrolase